MILLFSEARADYAHYRYSYAIWAMPEPGETPKDFFRSGFLPGSPQLDRFYLCRNLRVPLATWEPTSENRRVLRKGQGIAATLVPRSEFDYTAARRERWKAFADERFGRDVMGYERLDRLMSGPVISHLLQFVDQGTGQEVGVALVFVEEPHVAFYYYAFYDLTYFERNLGMFMMTRAVQLFAQRGLAHVHLGTCYSQRALYKTQFAGVEFFNGFRWSTNLEELKFLLERDQQDGAPHALELPEFRERFYDGDLPGLARMSKFRL